MTIPISVYPPPFNLTRASHAVLTVQDLAASRAFYVEALGLVVSDEDGQTLYLRGIEEACHHSLVLKQRPGPPSCERVGFRVYSEDDLERAKAFFAAQGLPAAFVDVPHQGLTLHATDVIGTPLELCARMETRPRMVVRFETHRGPCPQRLDHVQLLTPRVEEACAFYCGMGFRLSEFVAIDGTDELVFGFLQRKGNPHDIVFANGSGPRLHHLAYLVPDAAHMIQACDVAGSFGFGAQLEHGPGRHGPGHALFAYFRDPDGHRIEVFTTHYQVMDIENEPVRWEASYLRKRPWGLAPRRRWFEEASPFAGVAISNPVKAPKPATLESLLAADPA